MNASEIIINTIHPLFGENVKRGMNLLETLKIASKVTEDLYTAVQVNCIDFETLGIKCPDPNKDRICILFEYVLGIISEYQKFTNALQQSIVTTAEGISSLKDEKVKISSTGSAGYLSELLVSVPNTISFNNDKVVFSGFVPVGFRGTISANRLNDFDATGKGKVNTDVWGWAISNGQNGTINRLGAYTKYVENLLQVSTLDTISGNNEKAIMLKNINSFTLSFSGTVTESLDNNVKVKTGFTARSRYFSSAPGGHYYTILEKSEGNNSDYIAESQPLNLKHTHGISGGCSNVNPSPELFNVEPKRIIEIPIERINP